MQCDLAMISVLGTARAQQIGGHGAAQAGQHQGLQQLVLQTRTVYICLQWQQIGLVCACSGTELLLSMT